MRALIVAVVVGIGAILWSEFVPVEGQTSSRRVSYKETVAGEFPREWGDVIGAVSIDQTIVLLFKDGKGNIRRVEVKYRGAGVHPVVSLYRRVYE